MSIHPLDPPDSIAHAKQALELVRIWSVDGEPQFSIRVSGNQSPIGWGLVLVDIARLIAKGYTEQTEATMEEVMNQIRQGFDAEWYHPTNDEENGNSDD